jgi:hypothetical protein
VYAALKKEEPLENEMMPTMADDHAEQGIVNLPEADGKITVDKSSETFLHFELSSGPNTNSHE